MTPCAADGCEVRVPDDSDYCSLHSEVAHLRNVAGQWQLKLAFQADRLREMRLALSMLLDEIDSQHDDLSPGIWRAYSRAVEVLGKLGRERS